MSDLVGNPEDRFSHNQAHLEIFVIVGRMTDGQRGMHAVQVHLVSRNAQNKTGPLAFSAIQKSQLIMFYMQVLKFA